MTEFTAGYRLTQKQGIPFEWGEYLKLIDWTGRAIRSDKRGFIHAAEPPILQRLGLDGDLWLSGLKGFSSLAGASLMVDKIFYSLASDAA